MHMMSLKGVRETLSAKCYGRLHGERMLARWGRRFVSQRGGSSEAVQSIYAMDAFCQIPLLRQEMIFLPVAQLVNPIWMRGFCGICNKHMSEKPNYFPLRGFQTRRAVHYSSHSTATTCINKYVDVHFFPSFNISSYYRCIKPILKLPLSIVYYNIPNNQDSNKTNTVQILV